MELGGIYLRDGRDGSLQLAHHQGLSDDFVRATCLYPADSANARLVMEGRPVYTRHPELGAALTVLTLKEGLRALAVIPINWKERIIGCMNVASRKVDHVPMPARTALEAISYQIGSVIGRIRTEEALRESERRYVMVQNLAHVGYWERDYIQDKATWGDETHRIFGTDPSEGAPDLDKFIAMIHPLDREHQKNMVESIRSSFRPGMKPRSLEFRIIRKDGAERVILSKVEAMVAADGESVNLRGTVQDMTDMRDMEKRLSTISDAERTSVQRDLHDTICQDLSGIAFLAEAAKEDLHENPGEAAKSLDKIIALNEKALEQAKNIARGLNPLSNQPDALERALKELAHHVREIYGIPCRLVSRKRVSMADSLVSTQLYLIAREAVINAVKHAEASEIHVALSPRGRTLTVRVMDNGKGFDHPETVKGETSAGLKAMRERAHLIGATLDIHPGKSRGTVVECHLGQASIDNRDESREGVTAA
jgi:PAS domain S-box-containing protein